MLQRDYFLRILQEFSAAVAKFLEKNEGDDKKDDNLIDLWRQYVGDYSLIRNLTFDELIIYSFDQWKDDERVDKLEMVAELLYAEASYKMNPLRDLLLDKSFNVFDYVDCHSATFSIDRKNKMERIRLILGNL